MAAGRDTIVPTVQMSVMPTKRVLWDFLGASGVIIACDDDYIKDLFFFILLREKTAMERRIYSQYK